MSLGNSKANAIEKRLEALTGYWNSFAQETEPCLLRWLVTQDEARMIDVFLETENEAGGQTPDLFLVFDTPFETPDAYTHSLLDSFAEQYEASREILEEDGLYMDWVPSQTDTGNIITNFVQHCLSFKRCYASLIEHLVIVLIPDSVANPQALQSWLNGLVSVVSPSDFRIMIVDNIDSPLFEALAQQQAAKTRTISPELDMLGALMEIAQGVPGRGPDFKFRCHLVALINAANQGDLAATRRAYTSALTAAKEQNWLQMQVVAHMALGAAFLGAQKFTEALSYYREAGKTAQNAIDAGDPVGKTLLMQSRLAGGSAFIADGQFGNAAKVYELTAPLAAEIKEQLMLLECWRMAAYCHEQENQLDHAWHCGLKALAAGEEMSETDRKASPLAYASQGLLRVAELRQDFSGAEQVKEKTALLLGANWQNSFEGVAQS